MRFWKGVATVGARAFQTNSMLLCKPAYKGAKPQGSMYLYSIYIGLNVVPI